MLILFHVSAISLYSFALWYDQQYVDIPFPVKEFENVPFKARMIFFTFWCLALQILYFVVALLNDIFGTNATTTKPPLIRRIKDILFSITLNTALYVVVVFWSFYAIDKTLIFPDEAEILYPMWLNHTVHTLILPINLVELLATRRNYPSKRTGISVALLLETVYGTYIHILYFKYGIWPYPFLYVTSWPTKALHFAGSAILGMLFYLIGEKLDSLLTENRKVSHSNGIKKIH